MEEDQILKSLRERIIAFATLHVSMLAYAGGLTVAVLAVVLGTNIYQTLGEAVPPREDLEVQVKVALKSSKTKENVAPAIAEKPDTDKSTKRAARAMYYGLPNAAIEQREVLDIMDRKRSTLYADLRQQQLLPLGLRLSFVGTDWRNGSRVETDRLSRLNSFVERAAIIESNQDGFLLVWTHGDDGTITFLYPPERPEGSGRLSLHGRSQVRLAVPPDTSGNRRSHMRIYFGRIAPARFDDDSLRRMPPTSGYRYDLEYGKYSDAASPREEGVIYYVTPYSSILLFE